MIQNIAESFWRIIRRADNVRVVVLGHQKAGTTVIAALLGKVSGLEVSIDPLFHIDHGEGRVAGKLIDRPDMLGTLCRRRPGLFCKSIIKDPDLIFVFPSVHKFYKRAQFIFVVRDPRDTIRSICNRLGLSGEDLNACPSMHEMKRGTRHWEMILSGRMLKLDAKDKIYTSLVFNLAHRWNKAAEMYFEHADEMTCLKYEDFVNNKEKYIVMAANDLELQSCISISEFVDIQYQPKGESKTDWLGFFGPNNLGEIENICAESMAKFGYRPKADYKVD